MIVKCAAPDKKANPEHHLTKLMYVIRPFTYTGYPSLQVWKSEVIGKFMVAVLPTSNQGRQNIIVP